jgi:hypothetical protein
MKTVMVGFQLEVLMPVLAPVTTVETPVRFGAATAVDTTVDESVMTPALYETLLAGSAGPAVGVKAVEIADVVQVVAPPRWSVTVTTPSDPEIELDVVEATCDPSDTLADGVLIDNAPAVSAKVIGVAAEAGGVVSVKGSTTSAVLAMHKKILFMRNPQPVGGVQPNRS